MATTNDFNFNTYNALIKSANSGLRLFLAQQLLSDVEQTMRRFRSPLAKDVVDLVDEIADLRERNKKYVASLNRGGDGKLDNATLPGGEMTAPSTSADGGPVA
jgi:hypothetical protein